VKQQLFSDEHVRAIEQAARKQPDGTALDHLMEEENASAWQQIDTATLRVAMDCGRDPGSFVRRYEYASSNIVETNPSFTTIMTSHDVRFNHIPAPPIWRHRNLAMGFYPIRNCVSYRPTEPCVDYRDPYSDIHEIWFGSLPSIESTTSKTQLVCRFTFFADRATAFSDGTVRGQGTLDVTTRRVQFIPD